LDIKKIKTEIKELKEYNEELECKGTT